MKADKSAEKGRKGPGGSTADPEAGVMKMADGGFRPAYNIQFASLPENGIVVAGSGETIGSDGGLAEPMAQAIEETYGQRPKVHLVDGGYTSANVIEAAAQAGKTLHFPPATAQWGRDPSAPRTQGCPDVGHLHRRLAGHAGPVASQR